jgi:hypothetical protein
VHLVGFYHKKYHKIGVLLATENSVLCGFRLGIDPHGAVVLQGQDRSDSSTIWSEERYKQWNITYVLFDIFLFLFSAHLY